MAGLLQGPGKLEVGSVAAPPLLSLLTYSIGSPL